MRASCNRHVVSLLRRELGMNQTDFAWLVGCTASNVQAVEILRRKLSEPLAMRMFAETGVSPAWLLANDFGQPMIERNGQTYTKACFDRAQARKLTPTVKVKEALDTELISLAALLWSVMSSAESKSRANAAIALFRIEKFVGGLVEEYGVDFSVYDGKNRAAAVPLLERKIAECDLRNKIGKSKR